MLESQSLIAKACKNHQNPIFHSTKPTKGAPGHPPAPATCSCVKFSKVVRDKGSAPESFRSCRSKERRWGQSCGSCLQLIWLINFDIIPGNPLD